MTRANTPPSPQDLARLVKRVKTLELKLAAKGPRTFAGQDDVDADRPDHLDVATYDATLGKWTNQPGGSGTGGTDQFLDAVTGAALSGTTPVSVPWVVNPGGGLAAQPGNLVPDTLGGEPVARVTAKGKYVVSCSIDLALLTGADTQARVVGVVVSGSDQKALDADVVLLPAAPYAFAGLAAKLVLPFDAEVNDVVFVQASVGGGRTASALLSATALSIT